MGMMILIVKILMNNVSRMKVMVVWCGCFFGFIKEFMDR